MTAPLIGEDAIQALCKHPPWRSPPAEGTGLFAFHNLSSTRGAGAIVACYFEENTMVVPVMAELSSSDDPHEELRRHWNSYGHHFWQDTFAYALRIPPWFVNVTRLETERFTPARRDRAFFALRDALQDERVRFTSRDMVPGSAQWEFVIQLRRLAVGTPSGKKLPEHFVVALGCLLLAWDDKTGLVETAIRQHDMDMISHEEHARILRSLGADVEEEEEEDLPDLAELNVDVNRSQSGHGAFENVPKPTTTPSWRESDRSSSSSAPCVRGDALLRALWHMPMWKGSLEHMPDLFVIEVPPGKRAPGATVACHFDEGGAIVHLVEERARPNGPSRELLDLCAGPFHITIYRPLDPVGRYASFPHDVRIDKPTDSRSNARAYEMLRDAIHDGRLRFADTMRRDSLSKLFTQMSSLMEFAFEYHRQPPEDHLVVALSYAMLTWEEEEERMDVGVFGSRPTPTRNLRGTVAHGPGEVRLPTLPVGKRDDLEEKFHQAVTTHINAAISSGSSKHHTRFLDSHERGATPRRYETHGLIGSDFDYDYDRVRNDEYVDFGNVDHAAEMLEDETAKKREEDELRQAISASLALESSAKPEELAEPPDAGDGESMLLDIDECTVCMDAQRNVVLVPCGHIAVCKTCSEKLSKCPVCRAAVTGVVNFFVA